MCACRPEVRGPLFCGRPGCISPGMSREQREEAFKDTVPVTGGGLPRRRSFDAIAEDLRAAHAMQIRGVELMAEGDALHLKAAQLFAGVRVDRERLNGELHALIHGVAPPW